MDLSDYERQLSSLRRAGPTKDNVACMACEQCVGCKDSMFCVRCTNVRASQYLHDCEDCVEASHSRGSKRLVRSSHCDSSESCTGSAYLTDCHGLTSCTYCYGCVGLVGKDFHILNQPYDRDTFFRITRALSKARGQRPLP